MAEDVFLKALAATTRDDGTKPIDNVRQLAPNVQVEMAVLVNRRVDELLFLIDRCESPIEQLLGLHLFQYHSILRRINPDYYLEAQHDEQTDAGTYRLDFCFHAQGPNWNVTVGIECDGHDFHERTKEQAKRDKRRDRALERTGMRVIRFTGSEIHKSPNDCAKEVITTIQKLCAQAGGNTK